MPLTGMIKEVWSARLRANLDKSLVCGRAVNRSYQPDAQYGNLIHTDQMGPVTVGDYTKGTKIGDPEQLDADQVDILIDQQKFYNFFIDSIDEAQTEPNLMDTAMGRASYSLATTIDSYIAGLVVDAGNAIGTDLVPVTPDATTIYGTLTEIAKVLDEANVPTADRFIIMNPAGVKVLKDSGEMLSDTAMGDTVRTYGQFGGAASAPNGYKGRVADFDIWMSNNLIAGEETGTDSIWLAGHAMGIAMVDSVNKISGYEPQELFGEAVKGLYVFGAKVVQPTALVSVFTTL